MATKQETPTKEENAPKKVAAPKAKKTVNKAVKKTKEKKQPKNRTTQGGKRVEVVVHPPVKRVTSYGQIIESRTAVVVFGRVNPPSIGHERLVREAAEIAVTENGHAMLFLSPTNNIKNPLTDSQKAALVTEAFGDMIDVREEKFSNPILLLQAVSESYDRLIWVTGSDQAADYTRIAETYNGEDFVFEEIDVVSLDRSGSQLDETISATALRQAVMENDMETFRTGLPTKLQGNAEMIFEQVSDGISINQKDNPLINKVREALIGG